MSRANSMWSCSAVMAGLLLIPFAATAQISNGSGGMPQSQQPTTQTQQTPMQTDPSMSGMSTDDSAAQMRDRMFLRESAQDSMAEIKLAQLAVQKSNNADVKQFAQKMEADHTMLIDKMKPIADKAGVKSPDKLPKDAQKEYEKLNALSGTDFDKEYIAAMVKDHHKDLKKFQQEASATQNTDLKAAVDDGSKVIAIHTQLIDQLASRNSVTAKS